MEAQARKNGSQRAEENKNPFRKDLPADRYPEPATIVIFGASGDLTKRKLVPALYSLAADKLLPRVAIVGTSRSEISDEEFAKSMQEGVQEHARVKPADDGVWNAFGSQIAYQQLSSFEDKDSFVKLKERLETIERKLGLPGNRLFYLSTPPTAFAPIIKNLGAAGLVDERTSPYSRVIIEKPFGTDLASAQKLNREVRSVLEENQIFRIDHYLGKETVQNMLVFRFANGIFEPLWNSKYIDHVQITGAETLGVESRGGYFDHAGILRDMVQNHLSQVMCLTAMEPPVAFDAEAVRDEKLKVLRALRPIEDDLKERVVRAQYTAGSILGTEVPGYREEKDVDKKSKTETFVAMKVFIDNFRWAGVPFYVRSGKRLPKRVTEVAIHFKAAPHRLFRDLQIADVGSNILAIRIQPDEGISLSIGSKVPGPSMEIAPVTMEFRYASSFGVEAPEAYERLLLDALNGDNTLFTRGDEVEASWRFISPILEAWGKQKEELDSYPAGTWGPERARELLKKDGRSWRKP